MHYFVDFKELKIKKEYNPHILNAVADLTGKTSLLEIDKVFNNVIDKMLSNDMSDSATLFTIAITPDENADTEDLVSYANLIVPMLLQKLETGKGYKREHRLDAPDRLKALNTKTSIIKRASNHDMRVHCLNIKIEFGPFIYYLCDGPEVKELDHE